MVGDRLGVREIIAKKKAGEKIVSLTAYDYFTASYLDKAGMDFLLVGDSMEMVIYGSDTTLTANMSKMIHHTEAVVRGSSRAMVVADMPFMSYQASVEEAVRNAGRLIQAGAGAVKVEGGEKFADVISAITRAGIPVMGHLGMLPQSVLRTGGYITHGKSESGSKALMRDAHAIHECGVFAVVLEKVEPKTAKQITESIPIPTIGIGSGPDCDGQILVVNDILGLFDKFEPAFAKKYIDLKSQIIDAAKTYADDVKNEKFPEME